MDVWYSQPMGQYGSRDSLQNLGERKNPREIVQPKNSTKSRTWRKIGRAFTCQKNRGLCQIFLKKTRKKTKSAILQSRHASIPKSRTWKKKIEKKNTKTRKNLKSEISAWRVCKIRRALT
jgi:hypothetical protein